MAEQYHVVQLGEEELRLRYQVQHLMEAKKVCGQTVGQLLAAVTQLDLNAMAVLLWVALRPTRHDFKLADAGPVLQRWIDQGNDLEDIGAALMQTARTSGLMRSGSKDQEKEGEDGEGPKAD